MPDPDSAASLLASGPAADPDPVARHAAELRSRVAEHLTAGETVRAAVWVTRAPGRPVAPAAGATLAPALEALPVPAGGAVPARTGEAIPAPAGEAGPVEAAEADRRGILHGDPQSNAAH